MIRARRVRPESCESCNLTRTASPQLFFVESPQSGCQYCISYGGSWVCTLHLRANGVEACAPWLPASVGK